MQVDFNHASARLINNHGQIEVRKLQHKHTYLGTSSSNGKNTAIRDWGNNTCTNTIDPLVAMAPYRLEDWSLTKLERTMDNWEFGAQSSIDRVMS